MAHYFHFILVSAALAAVASCSPAPEQAPEQAAGQAAGQAIRGKVLSVAADMIVVSSQGKTVSVPLAPDWMLAEVAPTTLASIKTGSFVGTTNMDQADGGGVASEVHIFPPGSRLNEGQRVLEGTTRMTNGTVSASTRMTNGTVTSQTRMSNGQVSEVKANSGETILELSFAGGTRRVRVPADALITSFTPADKALLKPGFMISTRLVPGANGATASARFVTTGPNGTAPLR